MTRLPILKMVLAVIVLGVVQSVVLLQVDWFGDAASTAAGPIDTLLDVIDDGIGMSPGDLKHYFDPFFTTKRGSGGTGLGANIIFNQVTNVLGGSIRASSTPGAGLQVSMRLPRTRATAEASA